MLWKVCTVRTVPDFTLLRTVVGPFVRSLVRDAREEVNDRIFGEWIGPIDKVLPFSKMFRLRMLFESFPAIVLSNVLFMKVEMIRGRYGFTIIVLDAKRFPGTTAVLIVLNDGQKFLPYLRSDAQCDIQAKRCCRCCWYDVVHAVRETRITLHDGIGHEWLCVTKGLPGGKVWRRTMNIKIILSHVLFVQMKRIVVRHCGSIIIIGSSSNGSGRPNGELDGPRFRLHRLLRILNDDLKEFLGSFGTYLQFDIDRKGTHR